MQHVTTVVADAILSREQ